MMSYGMMASPGLVINEKLISSGKLYSIKEIVSLIEKHLNQS
ncbi:MAG: thioredoxin family protein [Erysipelotrichaceae bacterium]|nr:thioredoxin family protein [Erysipelotrichaceae bacterium]